LKAIKKPSDHRKKNSRGENHDDDYDTDIEEEPAHPISK